MRRGSLVRGPFAFLCSMAPRLQAPPLKGVQRAVLLVLVVQAAISSFGVNDLDIYHQAGSDLLAGENAYHKLYNAAYSYLYGPFFALLLAPLFQLGLPLAKFIWGLISIACLGRSYGILQRWTGIDQRTADLRAWTLIIVMLVGFQSIRDNLNAGQTTPLLLWCMLEAVQQARAGRPLPAALLLAFAIDIKVLPIAGLAYLVHRRYWRTALLVPVMLLALQAPPLLVLGRTHYLELAATRWQVLDPRDERHILDEEEPDFISIGALLSAYMSVDGGNQYTLPLPRRVVDLDLDTMKVVILLARLALIASVLFFMGTPFRGADKAGVPRAFALSYILLMIPLAFPHQQGYSTLFALPALLLLVVTLLHERGARRPLPISVAIGLVITALTFSLHLLLGQFGPVYDHYKVQTFGLLLAALLLAVWAYPERHTAFSGEESTGT